MNATENAGLSFFVDNTTYFNIEPASGVAEGYYTTLAFGTTKSGGPSDQPFFLLTNLAVGGTFSGDPTSTSFPQSLYIGYIRMIKL